MSRKTNSKLTIAAVAFTLVLGLGALNPAKAVQGQSGERGQLPAGQVNLLGADEAGNRITTQGRDADLKTKGFAFDTYGLRNTLRP